MLLSLRLAPSVSQARNRPAYRDYRGRWRRRLAQQQPDLYFPAAGHEWVIIAVSRSAPLGDHHRRDRLVAGEQPGGVARDESMRRHHWPQRASLTGRWHDVDCHGHGFVVDLDNFKPPVSSKGPRESGTG